MQNMQCKMQNGLWMTSLALLLSCAGNPPSQTTAAPISASAEVRRATTAADKPCVCAHGGRCYAAGERAPFDCNTCLCGGDGKFSGCTILACETQIAPLIFAGDSEAIDARADRALRDVAKALVTRSLTIAVEGHASSDETNPDALSLRRARAVEEWLLRAGLPKGHVRSVEGFGATRPRAQAEGQNRRVELVVVK